MVGPPSGPFDPPRAWATAVQPVLSVHAAFCHPVSRCPSSTLPNARVCVCICPPLTRAPRRDPTAGHRDQAQAEPTHGVHAVVMSRAHLNTKRRPSSAEPADPKFPRFLFEPATRSPACPPVPAPIPTTSPDNFFFLKRKQGRERDDLVSQQPTHRPVPPDQTAHAPLHRTAVRGGHRCPAFI